MQSTSEITPTETLIENAERQRRLLRRAAWAGVAFVVVAILFAIGYPLFIRWQLRQHGWSLQSMSHRGLPDWVPYEAYPWFGRIDLVTYDGSPVRTGDFHLLRRLPELEWLGFYSAELSDAQLEKISRLPNLSGIEFDSVRFDSTGLHHLVASPKLKVLNFFNIALDDSAIESISTCRRLEELRVCGITDDQLKSLSRLRELKSLAILNSRMTDDGWQQLPSLFPELQLLMIRGATLSNTAIAEFGRLSKLRTVQLEDVPITDDGIPEFKSCSTLQLLFLKASRVTSVGADELRKNVPTLQVEILK